MSIKLVHNSDELPENHEINVTPFIDVMLVLLIVFMIAAPLATVSVPLELPVSTADTQPDPQEPVYLSLQSNLTVSLGDRPIAADMLGPELERATKGDKQARVFLRADKTVDYGDLMALMDRLRDAGYLKVALVSLEQTQAGAAGAPVAGGRP